MTEWETAAPAVAETPDIKLFGKWSTDDVQINDISLQDYIAVKEKYAKYLPHSAGRYAAKRFRKAQCPIVERLTNSMMMHGRNNGKKLMTVRIVKHAFEIIHLLTGENPLQVLVNAIINSGPREDSTRIGRAGTVRRQAVDVSPLRRVNQVSLGLTHVAGWTQPWEWVGSCLGQEGLSLPTCFTCSITSSRKPSWIPTLHRGRSRLWVLFWTTFRRGLSFGCIFLHCVCMCTFFFFFLG
uniref:Small ribosomal subunit protein uS7 n=1 Tax=Macaca fascicularis TaxID=9541 RepID=A0A7N9CAI0_MACFA